LTRAAAVALCVGALVGAGCGHYASPIRDEAITSDRGSIYDAGQRILPDQPATTPQPRPRPPAEEEPLPPLDPFEPYDPYDREPGDSR
jgi:hypothetical protein